jgi:hypothetical protein
MDYDHEDDRLIVISFESTIYVVWSVFSLSWLHASGTVLRAPVTVLATRSKQPQGTRRDGRAAVPYCL